jgi:hypothetical protein
MAERAVFSGYFIKPGGNSHKLKCVVAKSAVLAPTRSTRICPLRRSEIHRQVSFQEKKKTPDRASEYSNEDGKHDYSGFMASTGQTSSQAPQSMHSSISITCLPPCSLIASTGHTPSHAPQLLHSSVMKCFPTFSTSFPWKYRETHGKAYRASFHCQFHPPKFFESDASPF